MPLTFAHPAAVLPFSRNSKYVNFLAMVLGSMSPDFEYFLRGKPYGEIGHTLIGFFIFNLPIVIIVYLIYKTSIHRTLFSHLPYILQDTYSQKISSTKLLKVIVFLYSALFGMLTHVFWDTFTHIVGYMVRNLSILTYNVHIFDFNIPIFKFLQHGSTIVGIIAIIGYMYFRTAKNRCIDDVSTRPKQKWFYWGQLALLTILLFCLWYFIDKVSIESYGIIVVRIIDSALISLLIVSLYFNHLIRTKIAESLLK
ncbi:DUF4184 family protein [Pseudoneobacillus rhizosphaerae]|uniref:DUF4184 family protein n=1 Tax=Pseudoneobacillus rhizosphaerae TaxID=2880968 RepID=A0A9C7G8H6_9BACI|nr:DUF4184 family protein [Pseudoneobacillus rhizosphaerae]CAG9607706.1 hypothetical protein NEOCIP111885_01398 [Pseudoneobacillus rhizosphaerae]